MRLNDIEVVAFFDNGATHSFVREDWAYAHKLPLTRRVPVAVGFFNEQDLEVTWETRVMARIGQTKRWWTFFVLPVAAHPVVFGLPAVQIVGPFSPPWDLELFVPKGGPCKVQRHC